MENHLESIKEAAEGLEEMEPSRLRLAATLAVILVTAATVVTTLFASMASNNGAIAQRHRQEFQAHATADSLLSAQQVTAAAQQRDDTTEAEWRSLLFDQVATGTTDPTVAAQLRAEAAAVKTQEKKLAAAEPETNEGSGIYEDQTQVGATTDEQIADAYASESSGWVSKESGYLATISIFAVALFLLGLALTLASRSSASSFVGLALVLLLVGVGRVVLSATSAVPAPSKASIHAYTDAVQDMATINDVDLSQKKSTALSRQAAASLHRALAINPTYALAWEALGNLTLQAATKVTQYPPAIADLRKAIAYGHPFPSLYNDVGYLQALSKDYSGASDTLHQSLALDPHNVITLSTLAELRVVQGNLPGANQYLVQALRNVSNFGPVYQSAFFQSLRLDESNVSVVAPHRVVDLFWTEVRNAEVSLSVTGQFKPGNAHGATISNIKVQALDGAAGAHGGSTVSFDYAGLRKGDVVTTRWYKYDEVYEPAASTNLTVPDYLAPGKGSQPAYSGLSPLLDPGIPQTMEVFVNGVFMTSYHYTPPGTAVN